MTSESKLGPKIQNWAKEEIDANTQYWAARVKRLAYSLSLAEKQHASWTAMTGVDG